MLFGKMALQILFLIPIVGMYFSSCCGLNTSNTDHFKQLSNSVDVLNQTVEYLLRENAALKQDVAILKADRAQKPQAVAFQAALQSPTKLYPAAKQIIRFDQVLTNVGNAYESRIGHFTAPVKGIYMFTMTIMNLPGEAIYVEMVKNGDRIALGEGVHADYDTITDVASVILEVNDLVWVRSADTAAVGIYGGGYSTFSGFLITEL